MKMKTRTEIINEIIANNQFKTYLEIGLGNCKNFDAINCDKKIGVDPLVIREKCLHLTSDEFFEINLIKFDLIFIDGLHHADQLEKDIFNAYNCLTPGGIILIHDVNPTTSQMQQIPRGDQVQWTGNVWRCAVGFKLKYPKIKSEFIPEKYGLFVIYKNRFRVYEGFTNYTMTFKEFCSLKPSLGI
jgi:hypothetical protein